MIGQTSQIVQELSAGGMVVVYLAHDSRLEPPVALKCRSRGGRPEYRGAFGMAVRETARADDFQLADLRHEAASRSGEAAVPTKARKVLSVRPFEMRPVKERR